MSSSEEAAIAESGLSAASPAAVRGWAAYPLGVAWGLGQVGADLAGLPGFDVHFASEVPVGAGLSSSAALESSLAVALNEVWQLGFDRARLVEAAHLAENDFVGAPTGILDQSASLLSVEGAALFLDCRDASSSPVDLGLDAAGLAVLVIDTKVKHEHVSGGYAARRASCERAARDLGVRALRDVTAAQLLAARARLDDETFRRARHVVTEDQRVLDTVEALRARDHPAVGGLMSASHRSMRDDFEISTPELDLAVEVAVDARRARREDDRRRLRRLGDRAHPGRPGPGDAARGRRSVRSARLPGTGDVRRPPVPGRPPRPPGVRPRMGNAVDLSGACGHREGRARSRDARVIPP